MLARDKLARKVLESAHCLVGYRMVSARLSFQFMHRNSHRTAGPTVNASSTTTIIQSGEASVLTSEEPPPHSGELKHALPQAGGPTQSQLSRPMSSGHHISMEHRLRRKQLNSDTNASNKKYLKEVQEKTKEETFSSEKMKKENEKH